MVARVAAKPEPRQGLHYMDPRRHMKEVVDLLEAAFGRGVDAEGRLMLREMRLVARLSPWLGHWVLGPGVYGSAVVGFVWLEGGHVVGHVTVQRADYEGLRWQIANVAVAEPFRGRGIGRALMEAALDHIRRERGHWAMLQVRADNAPAVHLYRSLGFEDIGGESRWAWERSPASALPPAPTLPLVPLSYRDTVALYDLQTRSLDEAARWWWGHHVPAGAPGGLLGWLLRVLGLRVRRRYGYRHGGHLLARLDLVADRLSERGELRVQVDTRYWGQWEDALVARAVREAASMGLRRLVTRVSLEHTALRRALENAGFREYLRLLNMRKRIVV